MRFVPVDIHARHWATLASWLLVCATVACTDTATSYHVGLNGPTDRERTLENGRFLPLTADTDRIFDAEGRQLILRGLQHHSLQDVDYYGRDVAPGDYATMADWGFTTLRMAISWSRIEPKRGQYDSAYIDEIVAALDRTAAAGLTAIVEMHQDAWGRCGQAADSPYRVNANGAPNWTCPPTFHPVGPFDYWRMFDRLWGNDDGLLDTFEAMWCHTIGAIGAHPALAGYDVFNEPQGTGESPILERDKLYPAYRRIVPKMRDCGAKGLLFLDAPILRNESPYQMYTEPLDDIGAGLIFAPHLYTGWLKMYILKQNVPTEEKQRDFAAAAAQAADVRLPLWNGEWGVNLLLDDSLVPLRAHVELEDEYRIGSSYWAFQHAVPDQGDDSISGGQSILNEDKSVRHDVVDILSRPYPIQTPGRLTKLRYDFDAHTLRMELDIDKTPTAPLVLYVPERHLGDTVCLDVTGPDGWTFDPAIRNRRARVAFGNIGTYTITLKGCISTND